MSQESTGYPLEADEYVAHERRQGDETEITLTGTGAEALEADPEAVVPALGIDGSAVVLASRPPAPLVERFTAPYFPKLLHLRRAGDEVSLVGRLDADTHWLRGHFPGEPILPGVAQLHWAVELGHALFELTGTFRGLDSLKFQQIMQPGRHFTLVMDYGPERARLRFAYRHAGGHFSQGRVRFGMEAGR